MSTDLGNKSAKDLADFIQRIESLMGEMTEVKERITSEYAAASGVGFDKKALKQIIKERAADSEKTVEHRAVVETYRRALGGLSGTPLGDWARGWLADDSRRQMHSEASAKVFDDWLASRKPTDNPDGEGDKS